MTRQTGDALDALCAMCCGALAAKHKGQYQLFLATFGDTDARDAYLNNASAQLAPYTQAYTVRYSIAQCFFYINATTSKYSSLCGNGER